MKDHPPKRDEAIRMMSENPNLIRRPILVDRNRVVLGFDEPRYEETLKATK